MPTHFSNVSTSHFTTRRAVCACRKESEFKENPENLLKMSETDLPSDIEEIAQHAVSSLLPEKSKNKYKKEYDRFVSWCKEKNIKNFLQEKVFLAYFETLSQKYSSSSLWAFYSMIRATISMKNNVDISKFAQLQALLKRKSEGYKAKKSKTFTKEEIGKFLKEAEDKKFLLVKVSYS